MATITGSEVLAQALRSQGVDTMFYLMGGPMLETEAACIKLGIRAIDHRHEQAAAFAAHACTRVTAASRRVHGRLRAPARPTCSPAWPTRSPTAPRWSPSAAPARACSSAWRPSRRSISSRCSSRSPSGRSGSTTPSASPTWWPARSARPPAAGPAPSTSTCRVTSWARRSRRTSVTYPPAWKPSPRTLGDPAPSRRPSRCWRRPSARWSSPAAACGGPTAPPRCRPSSRPPGIPFYTTPISRGLIPEDHALSFLNARSKAFTEADVVLAVGTRFNWVIQFGRPPRFARRSQGHPRRHQPDPARPQPRRRRPDRRRRARGARAAPRGGARARSTPSATRPGPASCA